MRNIVIFLTLLTLLSACRRVQLGSDPEEIDARVPIEKKVYQIKADHIDFHYAVSHIDNGRKSFSNLIVYWHGIMKNEMEWIKKGGAGSLYYDFITSHPELPSYPVVSVSLGAVFLLLDNAPAPYFADLEKLFLEQFIPDIKKQLSVSGATFLIGHSLGGYNSLTLSLRHPEQFPVVVAFSPYVAPLSPFSDDFISKGKELNMSPEQVRQLKFLLSNAYKNEENWQSYNPFSLAAKNSRFPLIALSTATEDLPGFNWSIKKYSNHLKAYNVTHQFCEVEGDHQSLCYSAFETFFGYIESFQQKNRAENK